MPIKNIQILEFPTETGIEEHEIFLHKKPTIIINAQTDPITGARIVNEYRWENLKIKFSEHIEDKPSKILKWFNIFYVNPKICEFAYGDSVNRKKSIVINYYDPVGVVVESFQLFGCLPFNIETEILKLSGLEVILQIDRACLIA